MRRRPALGSAKSFTRLYTAPVPARAARAIDPRCEQVTWVAWQLRGARTVTDEASLLAGSSVLARAIETLAMPGRVSAFTDLAWDPRNRCLTVRLAVGQWGPVGATESEADYLAAYLDVRLNQTHLPFSVVPADPRPLLALSECDVTHSRLIRQRTVELEVRGSAAGVANVELLSRFNPVTNSSESIARALTARTAPTRFRATVLAHEAGPDDIGRLDQQIRAVSHARRNTDYPEQALTLERAERTLLDIKASFGSAVFISELALTSPEPLPEVFVRTVAGAFTSDLDVLRRPGTTTVAGQPRLLGGHEHEAGPADHLDALRAGMPVIAGTSSRSLRDIVTLTECPLAFPVPVNEPIPGLATTTARPRPRVDALVPTGDAEAETILGLDPQGLPVAQLWALRGQHTLITGLSSSGKTTVTDRQQGADVAVARPMLAIDFHGPQHARALARHLRAGLRPVVLSVTDGRGVQMALLPALRYQSQLEDVIAAARSVADEFTSHLPAPWAGVVFHHVASALLEMTSAHEVELATSVAWLTDPAALRAAAEHPALSAMTRSSLVSFAQLTNADGQAKLQWAQAKFSSLCSGPARRLIAAAGEGVEPGQALLSGRSVLVDLSGLTPADASVAAHLILGRVLNHVMEVGPDRHRQIAVYVDEAHRAVPHNLERAWAESRKFGLAFTMATQVHTVFPPVARDLALGAGTIVALRQSPAAAADLALAIDVPARELSSLPNLEAIVRVSGQPAVTVNVPPYEDLGPLPAAEPLRTLPTLDLMPHDARREQQSRVDVERAEILAGGVDPVATVARPWYRIFDDAHATFEHVLANAGNDRQDVGRVSPRGSKSPAQTHLDHWLRIRRRTARQGRGGRPTYPRPKGHRRGVLDGAHIRVDEHLLRSVGLDHLPPAPAMELLQAVYDAIEAGVEDMISSRLGWDHLDAYDGALANGDDQRCMELIGEALPDYPQVVSAQFDLARRWLAAHVKAVLAVCWQRPAEAD